jgi:hypothetical protein
MELAEMQYTVEHVPGKLMSADALSRLVAIFSEGGASAWRIESDIQHQIEAAKLKNV